MSILDPNINININNQPVSEQAAKRLINQTRNTFNQMVQAFNEGAKTFWSNPRGATPTEVATGLGTNAAEVFRLHYALGQLISSVKPEAIQEGLSVIGQFTINEDGTVTVQEAAGSQESQNAS